MRDALDAMEKWQAQGHRFALAIVTRTWGSSPRPVGSTMAIRGDGLVVGSVSGGCVEGAVMTEALALIKTGEAKTLDFGAIPDEAFWAVGLSCGGEIHVMVLPDSCLDEAVWVEAMAAHREGRPWSLAIEQESIRPLQRFVRDTCPESDGWFLLSHAAPARLVVIGAVHIAISLLRFARELGFHTTVIDPRSTLADLSRFPVPPDELLIAWPQKALQEVPLDSNTYVAILSHDPKIDDVSLEMLLRSDVKYVGALGGRITQSKRRLQLEASGFTADEIGRIHGPIGLAIGALTPEEIALSVMAEIVKVRRAG